MKKKREGFSLVEILIALVLLGFGIVALLNLFPLGLQSLSYSHRLNEVAMLAEKKLEELKIQKPVPIGKTSGKEGDMNWDVSTSTLKLAPGVEVVYAELDIGFDFQKSSQKQRFVTYLTGD